MRSKSLSILTVVLSLTIVSPSVYAGSQEPPIGPAPGPPKAPVEKAKPPQSKPSEPSGQKRILEPPFDLSRESPVTKPPKPSNASPDAKPDATSDEKSRKAAKNSQDKARPDPKSSPPDPNRSGFVGKLFQPKDADPKPKSETPAKNSGLRQERETKDLPGLPILEPQTAPRIAEAKPSGKSPENQPQGREPSGKAEADRVTASTGKTSSEQSLTDSGNKTADPVKEPKPSTEVAAASSQTDRQLPRTEKTPMPKTASHGPLLMVVGLLTAAVGWAGRKIVSAKG
ncbi:hypothetical protein CLV97_11339 [Planifilum fimeticola]|uniref:Uncharacterized protein n=1 Tax=Planifilum fimeticola TaxID=201975 RepID=A0A2T0LEC6_9BACL|nr:hypothetical protein [Planifilum fimeticola]PRX40453.1 hypothetical protein CLV97_11339 [Planifilum fimeticola]